MDLRRLRYFVAVAEELHFGRAAKRLHVSQPPLSQQIRQLESQLGVRLFERNRREVHLTEAGRLLLDRARPLLAEVERIEQYMAQAAAGTAGSIRVGFVSSAAYDLLPRILRVFQHRHPDVGLTLEEMTTRQQVDALRDWRLDVGLLRPPVDDRHVQLTNLTVERVFAALPAAHPLARRADVPLAALRDEPFVFFPRGIGQSLYEDVLSVCRQAGFAPRVVQEAAEMQTIISLVSSGIGVSLVPEAVTAFRPPHVLYRRVRNAHALLALALAKRSDERSPLLDAFRAAALEATRT